jgi:hypothetical protein
MTKSPENLNNGQFEPVKSNGSLRHEYGQPPFSVWSAREGTWQLRKKHWIALGIRSELGRFDASDKKATSAMERPDESLLAMQKRLGKTYNINSDYLAGMEPAKGNRRTDLNPGGGGGGPNSAWLHKTVDNKTVKGGEDDPLSTGTSIFDPVVCELAYRWWCPEGGIIVDPFAGGSVRGIVASVLDYKYWGCELRGKQVESNREQLVPGLTCGKYRPLWNVGDCRELLPKSPMANLLFSCPPYGDLEVYSSDPRDLSTLTASQFEIAHREVIALACTRLKPDSFACWVVGNYRDRKTGRMIDLVGQSVRAFEDAGLLFWNDIVLIHPAGSAPVRARGTFERGDRKMVKLHQNVLVFKKP